MFKHIGKSLIIEVKPFKTRGKNILPNFEKLWNQ